MNEFARREESVGGDDLLSINTPEDGRYESKPEVNIRAVSELLEMGAEGEGSWIFVEAARLETSNSKRTSSCCRIRKRGRKA